MTHYRICWQELKMRIKQITHLRPAINPNLIKNCSRSELPSRCKLFFEENKNINVIPIINEDGAIDVCFSDCFWEGDFFSKEK